MMKNLVPLTGTQQVLFCQSFSFTSYLSVCVCMYVCKTEKLNTLGSKLLKIGLFSRLHTHVTTKKTEKYILKANILSTDY